MSGLDGRCGTCARFVRVIETIDSNGEVQRRGECLLNVWPSPLKETMTCGEYVKRGTVHLRPAPPARTSRGARAPSRSSAGSATAAAPRLPLTIPEELLDMNADEFRAVLREVIRDELGASDIELGARWVGGEVILKPGKEGTQEKRVPIDAFFHKVVMIRDKLRVLEQRINGHGKLTDDEKIQLQQYITGCYGTLTTFNVLFAEKEDGFIGQRGDE
ncbi:MAG TPA: hypothetical protein VGI39_28950 [Polyangiaceae bacterium]|jgi:hypothetical protein